MGLWRGKKGSTVFYKLTNSNNAQKQGIRERVYEVSNPQSNGQATQRAKLLPAQRVAGALREIVERGWQGVDYGSKSRSEFLKRALKMSSGYPYIVKDDDRIVPGAYQITKGTLAQIALTWDDSFKVDTNIMLGDTSSWASSTPTIGDLSQSIIDNNANLQSGDQLTFIVAIADQDTAGSQLEANYTWGYLSFFIDESNTDSADTLFNNLLLVSYNETNDDCLSVTSTVMIGGDQMPIAAVAVVVSRLGDAGQYMRSTAKLMVNTDLLADWYSVNQRRRAQESYQTTNAAVANTNWPVDGDAEETAGTYQSTLTLAGLTGDLATANGQQILVRKRESDDTLVAVYYKIGVISEAPSVVKSDGSFISVGADVETRHELMVSECPQVSDLQKILYQ